MSDAKQDTKVGCCICGTMNDLRMFAHRGVTGLIVGWIFLCPDHIGETIGATVWLSKSGEGVAIEMISQGTVGP